MKTQWRYTALLEGAVVLVFLIVFFVLRPGTGDEGGITDLAPVFDNDRPTLAEFFSNYCTSCLLLRPTFDQLARDLQPEFNILRINIHSLNGRQLRQQYNFSFTPEFILFDADGNEVWRDHALPTQAQLDLARKHTTSCTSC
ncbi:MAG: thioredoxin domain-containing protein [Anaerolineae bacterium]|nr:thioredoxin domain-containing protein [Anaerolineae bacterium]